MLDTFAHNLTQSLSRYAGKTNATPELHALMSQLVTAEDSGHDSVKVDVAILAKLHQDFPTLFGGSEADTPLVVLGEQVSTRRHYQDGKRIVDFLSTRADVPTLSKSVFLELDTGLDIWQKVAVFACVYNRITLITGGAGTGKTTTLMHAVTALRREEPTRKIVLSAPTGKAVKRIQQALGQNPHAITTKTLHQLLGIKEETSTPYFHSQRQLDCDVLVIDEASMVGQGLFSLVMDALPRHAKLILLGDHNQLPPVNAVPVFHPVVRQPFGFDSAFCVQFENLFGEPVPSLDMSTPTFINHHVKLQKTFRFGDVISELASAVLAGDCETLCNQEAVQMPDDITGIIIADIENRIQDNLTEQLLNNALPTVLCVMRHGLRTTSTEVINAKLDQVFRERLGTKAHWYVGRKIIIEKNDYDLGVFNGDVGICIEREGERLIEFEQGRTLTLELLPPHSLAFAITIHKSQGSEYDEVCIAFTAHDENSELLSKDMLYTAITRAKRSVKVLTTQAILRRSMQQRAKQDSLIHRLLTLHDEG